MYLVHDTGDTAQTIAAGVNFRFEKFKALHFELVPGRDRKSKLQLFYLLENFRTHDGILKVANIVVKMIVKWFPQTIDQLPDEKGRASEAKPIYVVEGGKEDLLVVLFGSGQARDREGSAEDSFDGLGALLAASSSKLSPSQVRVEPRIKGKAAKPSQQALLEAEGNNLVAAGEKVPRACLGADQVILVRDEAALEAVKDANKPESVIHDRGVLMTIVQSKGMEFRTVVLLNFFKHSPLQPEQWRVVFGFLSPEDIQRLGGTVRSSDVDKLKKHPSFNGVNHQLLCRELKLFYVAVTRTCRELVIFDIDPPDRPLLALLAALQAVNRQSSKAITEGIAVDSNAEEWYEAGVRHLSNGTVSPRAKDLAGSKARIGASRQGI